MYAQVTPAVAAGTPTALLTPIIVEAGADWTDTSIDGLPLSYRFGLRTLSLDGDYADQWWTTSMQATYSVRLAAGED
jgi:hypothetical protein